MPFTKPFIVVLSTRPTFYHDSWLSRQEKEMSMLRNRVGGWAIVLFLAVVAYTTTAQAELHTFAASGCQPVNGHTNVKYIADGGLEMTSTTADLGFTCTFDNEKNSGSSTSYISVLVRDYSDEAGTAGQVSCQAYSSSSFTGSLSWGDTGYSTGTGVQTVNAGDYTAYGGGVIGVYCVVPRYDASGGGWSKLYRISGLW